MPKEVTYLQTATQAFIDLQSGLARPYWEANITVQEKIPNTTVLLLHGEGDNNSTIFVDSSPNNYNVTATGNTKIDTTQKKYGNASIYFDGNDDKLRLTGNVSDWNFGNNDFTIETWFRLETLPKPAGAGNKFCPFFTHRPLGWRYFRIQENGAGGYQLFFDENTGTVENVMVTGNVVVDTGIWYHAAIVRNSSTWTLYFNGTTAGYTTTSTTLSTFNTSISIGHNDGPVSGFFGGWLDDFVITRKALYTQPFTPNPGSFPGVASGVLGQFGQTNNDIISFGTIDRERSITISGTDKIIAGDLTLKLLNDDMRYSPNYASSIFYDKDWVNATVKIWCGFDQPSGTALVVPKGTFSLEDLTLDGKKGTAELRCKDKLGYALSKYIGMPYMSGTANARLWTGTTSSKTIITDLLSGLGLTAGDYDITQGVNFTNLTVSGQTYGTTLAKVAQASEGFLYVDNVGKVRFKQYFSNYFSPRYVWDLSTDENIIKSKLTISNQNLMNVVGINYGATLGDYNSSESTATVPKGRTFVTDNAVMQTRAQAQAFTTRNLVSYNENRSFLELDNLWMPAVELGDYLRVTDENIAMSGSQGNTYFEIYKIRDDPSRLKQTIYGIDTRAGQKFGMLSDTGADVSSVVYTGAWTTGFCFLGYNSSTAAYPGFDAGTGESAVHSGANNNVINNSGLPNDTIEEPFILG
jgi:hypothetical protein